MSKARSLSNLFSGSTDAATDAEVTAAVLAAVPSQTGNSGKYLTTNGSNTSWSTINLSSYATTDSLLDDEILSYMGAF